MTAPSQKRAVILPKDPSAPANRLTALKPEKPPDETVSETAERYMAAVRRSLPKLTTNEWCLIFDALRPNWQAGEEYNAALAAEIAEAIASDRLDAKWETDGQKLAGKIQRLDYAGKMSVSEFTEMFWANNKEHSTYAETIQACLKSLEPEKKKEAPARTGRMSPRKAGTEGAGEPENEAAVPPAEPETEEFTSPEPPQERHPEPALPGMPGG